MPFLTQGKTNWKYILIIVILAVIVVGGIFWLSKEEIPIIQLIEIKKKEKDEKYCKEDNDCLFLTFQCCPKPDPCHREPLEVINKANKKRKEEELKSKCTLTCPSYAPPSCFECLDLENFTPICINNKCDVRREINCENYCKAIAEDKSKPCPWISNESLITEENTKKCNCETANWKTYRNEKYGFEFKYPSIPSGCENCKIQESEEGFTVNRTDLSIDDLGELNLSEFVDKKMGEFEIERKEKILIGGKEGIKVDYRFGGMGRFGSVAFVEKNKKVIIFEFTAGGFCCSPETDRIYESDVYEAMLSTFRFLE